MSASSAPRLRRPELAETAARLTEEWQRRRDEMHALARAGSTATAAASLRGNANSLVLRSTQAALTAAKGAGFLRDQKAQQDEMLAEMHADDAPAPLPIRPTHRKRKPRSDA